MEIGAGLKPDQLYAHERNPYYRNFLDCNVLSVAQLLTHIAQGRNFTVQPFCMDHCPLFAFGATTPQWARASSFRKFLDHTQRRLAIGRTPLDEGSVRRRDLCLTTHNTHNRQTSMPPGWDSNPQS